MKLHNVPFFVMFINSLFCLGPLAHARPAPTPTPAPKPRLSATNLVQLTSVYPKGAILKLPPQGVHQGSGVVLCSRKQTNGTYKGDYVTLVLTADHVLAKFWRELVGKTIDPDAPSVTWVHQNAGYGDYLEVRKGKEVKSATPRIDDLYRRINHSFAVTGGDLNSVNKSDGMATGHDVALAMFVSKTDPGLTSVEFKEAPEIKQGAPLLISAGGYPWDQKSDSATSVIKLGTLVRRGNLDLSARKDQSIWYDKMPYLEFAFSDDSNALGGGSSGGAVIDQSDGALIGVIHGHDGKFGYASAITKSIETRLRYDVKTSCKGEIPDGPPPQISNNTSRAELSAW